MRKLDHLFEEMLLARNQSDLKSQRGFLHTHGVTSSANKVDLFLWQIITVIFIQSMITHIYMSRFQATSLAMAIASGNDSSVFPRNHVFGVAHICHKNISILLTDDAIFATSDHP
jgi:hypothetical protein